MLMQPSFQYIRNERALTAGVHLLPFIICGVSTVMLCGAMVSKLGRWIPWFFYGGTFVLIGKLPSTSPRLRSPLTMPGQAGP